MMMITAKGVVNQHKLGKTLSTLDRDFENANSDFDI
jgi:hypothetical protein